MGYLKMSLFLTDKKLKIKYSIIVNIIKYYNKKIYFLNKNFQGKIAEPNINNIKNKKNLTLNQYLNSKSIWEDIFELFFYLKEQHLSIFNYIDTILNNWETVIFNLNLKTKYPIPKIVFSKKIVKLYKNIDKILENKEKNNKKIVTEKIEILKSYDIFEKKLNNLSNLHKLSKLETLELFKNEFNQDFINNFKKNSNDID